MTYTDHTGLQPGSGEKHAVFVGDYPSDPSAWVIVEGPWKPRDYGPPTANDIVLLSEWDERNLGNLADSLGIDRDKMVVGGAIATMIAIALSLRKGGPGLVPSDTIFKGAKASPCVNKTFNRHGSMTTGKYTISRPGMTRHTNGIPGPEGKSQFFFRIEADSLVLDAAHYADLMRLWERNKAKIPLNDFIGVTGGGKPTTVINIYRDLKGRVHGAPGN